MVCRRGMWAGRLACFATGIVLVVVPGCSDGDRPPLGEVRGRVTLDNKPIESAYVVFTPIEGGRQSLGTTDPDGVFHLKYIRDISGAKVGAHKVVVMTRTEGGRETIPARYSDLNQTELRAEVIAGDNEINFPLKSQPPRPQR